MLVWVVMPIPRGILEEVRLWLCECSAVGKRIDMRPAFYGLDVYSLQRCMYNALVLETI